MNPTQQSRMTSSSGSVIMGGNSYNPTSAPRNTKRLILLSLLGILLLGTGVFAFVQNQAMNNPDTVFKKTLAKALATSSVTQRATSGTDSVTSLYDISDIKAPKVSTTGNSTANNIEVNMQGYGNMQKQYLKYTKFGGEDLAPVTTLFLNKWIVATTDEVAAGSVDETFKALANPAYAALGDWIIGNFSASDRKALIEYVTNNNIYAYDKAKVTKETALGKKVFVYSVTEDKTKLAEYNKRVGEIMGFKSVIVNDAVNMLNARELKDLKLYIDPATSQLIKVTASVSDIESTSAYSNYNGTSVAKEPTADLTWKQLTALGTNR